MVEDVVITGLDNLLQWATEKTQEEILKTLQSMQKLTSAQAKQVKQSVSNMGSAGKVSQTDFEKARKALTHGLKGATEGALETAAGFDKLPGPLRKFGMEIKKSSGAFKGALIGIGLLGNAIGATIKTVQESVNTLRKLTDSGVIFNQSIVSLHATLADTGLTLERFGEIAGKYARVMGTNGLQSLTQLITRTRGVTGGFERFGLTTADATEYAAEYLDQQRLAGVFAQANQRRQAQALQENIQRLTAYSKILNVSRQQLQETTRQMLDRDDLQALFFTMAPAERAKAQDAFQTISQGLASLGAPGQKVLELFTDMAASPIEENSDSFRRMASVAPEFAQELLAMSRNMKQGIAVSQEEVIALAERASANKALIDALRLAGGEFKTDAELLAGFGMAAEEARVSQSQLALKAAEAGMSLDDYLKTVDVNAQAATALDDSMQRLQATLEYTMIKGFAELVGGEARDAVHAMAEGLNMLTEKLRAFADGGLTDFMKMLNDFLVDGKGITGLVLGFGALTAAVGTVGAAFGALASAGLPALAGAIARFAGPAAGVAGAGYVGWQTGSAIYGATSDTDAMIAIGDGIGYLADNLMSLFGNEDAKHRLEVARQSAMLESSGAVPAITSGAPTGTAVPQSTTAAPAAAPVDTSRMEQLLEMNVDELRRLRRSQPSNDILQ